MRTKGVVTRAWPRWLLTSLLVSWSSGGIASELCQWTDDKGVTHLDDSTQVPVKYQGQCAKPASKSSSETPAAQHGAPGPGPTEPAEKKTPAIAPKRIEVPYKNEGSTRRVIISVTFNDSITAPMALDTGAPEMVMSIDLAQRLGLFTHGNGNLLVAAGGVGGSTLAVLTITDSVSVEGARQEFVPTTVMKSVSKEFEGLIGMDFLAGYTVSIDTKRQVVVFEESPADPNARGGHDEAWWRKTFKEFREARDRWRIHASSLAHNDGARDEAKALAEFEAREAEQLLLKLHAHASDVAVPQEWR